MTLPTFLRRRLTLRLLAIAAAAAPLSALGAGCSNNVASGAGGAGGGPQQTTQCYSHTGACPSQADAPKAFGSQTGCSVTFESGPLAQHAKDQCCYKVVEATCLTGRPFLVAGQALTAPGIHGEAARAWLGEVAVDVSDLTDADRAELAAAWARDGLGEHASIASFARFSLELMSVGAPPELLAEAYRAAMDEIEHARLCFALASAYAGEPQGPGAFVAPGDLQAARGLAAIATRTVLEGCVGETLAALQAIDALEAATEPAVRAALARIADDEARHAELAWQVVAWALASRDPEIAVAVRAAFASAASMIPPEEPARADADRLARHGRVVGPMLAASHARALQEVIRPCAEQLLGRDHGPGDVPPLPGPEHLASTWLRIASPGA